MEVSNQLLAEIVECNRHLLNEDYEHMFEYLGVEPTLKVCDYIGGTQMYIPSKKRITRNCVIAYVKVAYNGRNARELCRLFDIPSRTFRDIIGGKI